MSGAFLPLAISLLVPSASPYQLHWGEDLVTSGAALSVAALLEGAVKPSLGQEPDCRHVVDGHCDPADLNPVDRTVVGNDSASWRTVSDVGELSGIAVPILAALLDSRLHDGSDWLREGSGDALVVIESLALANAATTALKIAVRRPRPAQYGPDAASRSVERAVSFPSGHTTAAAAGSFAYAMTFALRHPESPWRYAVFGAATLLTGLTGYGRVAGGMHFYSDVLAGAIIGAASGYLVPKWHARAGAVQPVVSASSGADGRSFGMSLLLTF